MTVRDDSLGLADSSRDITTRPGVPPRPRRPLPAPPPADPGDLPRYLRAVALVADLDDLDTAYAACDLAVSLAGGWSTPPALGAALSLRGALSRRRGDLPAAERDGRAATGLLTSSDAYFLAVARRIAVLVDIGDIEDADALLASRDISDDSLPVRYVRGKLHAAAGRPAEALADFFHCGERLAARDADRPAILSWRSSAAAVLALIGTREAALRLVDAEVALCREAGATRGRPTMMGRPSALGRALRVRGTVLGVPDGIGSLEEGVRLLRSSPRRFELARALVDWGVLLTGARRKPQARRVLREGASLAARCGSPALVERAYAAYVAAGGKPLG
jgi:hypothetical protein